MRLRWTAAAASDLEEIYAYLAEQHPQFAESTITELYEGIRSLKEFPNRGRLGRELETRELVFAPLPYIAAYRVREQTVEILYVHHTSRRR